MDLFDLVAKITLDSSEYEKGLGNAENKASSFGEKLGQASKIAGAGIAAVGTATIAMSTALVKGASETAAYGDNIDKMSQKMGISAQAYQEWDAVLQHSGSSIEAMSRGMMTLQNKAANSAEAFEALGLSQEQVANMSTEELFEATIAGLQNMEEGAERTALASELLGGAAKELGPLLNTSAEDTQAMRDRVRDLGGVMSDEAVKAAAAFQDSLQDMQTSFDGLQRGMLAEFMPSITTVMDGLTGIFSGDSENGIALISEGISELANNISEQIPQFLEVGSGIVLALADAIISNLPQLLSAGTDALITIVEGILMQLPTIVSTGLQVLTTLAKGIGSNLKTIIPTIVSVILKIVETLTSPDSINAIIDGAIQLIIGLSIGFVSAIPQIIAAIPVIIQNIVVALSGAIPQIMSAGVQLFTALVGNMSSILRDIINSVKEIIDNIVSEIGKGVNTMVEAGKNLLAGLWNGIASGAGWLWSQVSSWLNSLWEGILGFFGIHSPSTEMAWVGEMLVTGLSKSIDANGDEAVSAAEKMSDDVLSAMDKLSENEFGADMNIERNVVDNFSPSGKTSRKNNSAFSSDELTATEENGIINIVVQSVLDGEIIGETAYQYQRGMARAMG